MAYSKTTWANGTTPAINAANLNKIENELETLDLSKTNLVKNASSSALGKNDLIAGVKFYDGYYINGAYTGTSTEIEPSSSWCVALIPVIKDKTITISNMAEGGTQSAWLNSANLNDINSVFLAANNNGTKTCVTNYLALSVKNAKANLTTYSVIFDILSTVENEISVVDNTYSTLNKIDQNTNEDNTDNLFSNRVEDWTQGSKPDTSETYAINMGYIDVTDGLYYIFTNFDNTLTGSLVIHLYSNGSFVTSLTYSSNGNWTKDLSSYDKICIAFSTGVGSLAADSKELLKKSRVYIGHSKIQTLADYYAKYIPKYSKYAFYEKELVANKTKQELCGAYSTLPLSDNMFSNAEDDWFNFANYVVELKERIPINNAHTSINMYVDLSSAPQVLTSYGNITVQCKNSEDETLSSLYFYIAGATRSVHIGDTIPSGTTNLRIYVALNTSSYDITPKDVIKLKAYIGFGDVGSLITTKLIPNSKYIPEQSRKVLNGGYLPDYWLDYLKVKAETILDKNDLIGEHGFSFAFYTDEHLTSNFMKSHLVLKWIKENTPVSRIVNGGDVLTEHSSIATLNYYVRMWLKNNLPLHTRNVRGNHDNNSMQTNPDYYLGTSKYYSNFVRPIENEITVEDGNTYFYEKLDSQKVIIFYLDTGDMRTSGLIDFDAQISWMDSIVQTLSSDWSILIIQHIVFDGLDEHGNPELYTTGEKIIEYLDTVNNCNVIGVVCGHTHKDYIFVTDLGYPIIVTTCDAAGNQSTSSGLTRTEGTVSEQAIDVFNIDTDNRTIYITRIGAGSDRQTTY